MTKNVTKQETVRLAHRLFVQWMDAVPAEYHKTQPSTFDEWTRDRAAAALRAADIFDDEESKKRE